MAVTTQKETIEYDKEFLVEWNNFCDSHGLRKRHAAHAARRMFMLASVGSRESSLAEVSAQVKAKRVSRA